uniref:3-beta hydroxysteroid dehydrogenase/isomerase domain-containing protein n=1 Tax=Chelonoidis abingdonii TaxID=106734 RepID=A0A8C0GWA1_CHEAB
MRDSAQFSMGKALVYLVTGGCGFIGEHIVELLCKQDYVSEVRVFDSVAGEEVKKFATATTCVTVMKGDIRDYDLLLSAMRGVHVVIHTAAIVDYTDTVPFREMKAVNVAGTENVLTACCTLSVPYVVYTSSIAAVGPNTRQEPMLRGTEDTKYSGEVELPYGKTKAMAEKLVLEANGKEVQKSDKHGKKLAIEKKKVWNVAWMHVLAARNLQLKPDILAGQVYYSYDDTPTRKGFLVRYQLLSGMDPSIRLGSRIPYWKLWLQIYFYRIIRILLYPFWKPQPFLNLPLLNTVTTTFFYETDKAFRHFGYTPLYSWGESKRRTTEWLKAATKNSRSHQPHRKET